MIRRDRPGSHLYVLPGGNVEVGEGLLDALRRELREELALDLDQTGHPELLWVIDQMVSRPGATPPPRKFHLIYRVHISPEIRRTLATQEYDEVPGGYEVGTVGWWDYRATADLPIFPPVAAALSALRSPRSPVADAALEAINDDNYTWV